LRDRRRNLRVLRVVATTTGATFSDVRIAPILAIAALLALAGPAAAQSPAGDPGVSVGPASLAGASVVALPAGRVAPLRPQRAKRVLARQLRVRGVAPWRVTCTLATRRTASCTVVADRGGARFTGTGTVRQGHRALRVSFQIAFGD